MEGSPEVRNPLEVPEILENILECLPLRDQKSCRLVNKFWRDCGIAPMKKKEKSGVRVGNQFDKKTIDDLAELSDCLDSVAGGISNFPCSKFFFSPSLIRSDTINQNIDELLVADFLQKISPWATELWLRADTKKKICRAAFPRRVHFPKLKLLEFSAFGLDSQGYENSFRNFFQFVTDIVDKAPALQKVQFMDQDNEDEHSVDAIIKAKSSFTELKISVVRNISMEKLSKWNRWVKLKSLDLTISFMDRKVNTTNLFKFLRSQNDSLEKLVLHFYPVSSPAIVTFPEMPKLKNLTIQFDDDSDDDEDDENTHDNITFTVISYQQQFPTLKALHLVQWNYEEIPLCKHFIQKDMQPVETLEELSLPSGYLNGESCITAENVVRIFPNIKKLKMKADSVMLPTFFEHWTNLEQLTLTLGHGRTGCIDYLLMGHVRSGYKRIQKRIEREGNDFDWDQLEPGNARESIINLQKLRILRFINEVGGLELEVTRASLHLIMSWLGSLRCIDFGNRSYPMDSKIDRAWWAQLNEDCVVLWNNIYRR